MVCQNLANIADRHILVFAILQSYICYIQAIRKHYDHPGRFPVWSLFSLKLLNVYPSVYIGFVFCLAAGEAWNSLTPEQKIPFEKLAEQEKLNYEQKMKDYNQVCPTFF